MTRELGKVYVTGADGFIGSHLVEALVARGCEVTALCVYNSNGSYGWLDRIAEDPPRNLRLILGDVRDPFFMESTIGGHGTVFHLASLIAIPYSYQAPQSYFETNALGALNVAQACLKARVQRLIHTSTSEVYGTAQFVPITEIHPLQGQSPYSASKIAADMAIESYHRSFDLPTITLRPFNTYGPRQSLRAVIPTVLSQIMAGADKIELGSLAPTRDFNFVMDTVAAFLAVAESSDDAMLGQVYNTGTGREVTVGDMVRMAAAALGRDVAVVVDPQRVRPKQSEVERLCSDASKLRNATGWAPRTTLEDGLRIVADWIQASGYLSKAARYHR